jgi:phospholipase C
MKTLKLSSLCQGILQAAALALAFAPSASFASSPDSFDTQLRRRINHIVVIYQENWSFDALYGHLPAVNGLANSFNTIPQLDKSANYTTYIYQNPQALNGSADNRFPPGNGQPALPLLPYDLTRFVTSNSTTGDIVHRFYTEQLQIDNGALETKNGYMDKFVTWSDNPGLVMSYFDASNLPEGLLAQQYTICDNFFHSAYGGSFLNHQFLVAARAPLWEQAIPSGWVSSYNATTKSLNDGHLTIDGNYVVNTTYSLQAPHPSSVPTNQLMLPINDNNPSADDYTPTIGDRLDAAHVTWKWYSGGWNNAIAGHADPLFQYHHQPFAYYANYAPFNANGTLNLAHNGANAHLQDEQNFFSDIAHNKLPSVSFIKPLGPDNEHPGYASLLQGQLHVASLVFAIQNSKYWNDTVVIITYDENGGRWDHVPPPVMDDGWGVGTRVPTIVVSKYTTGSWIDSTQYETVSILKLIERRWGLAPLSFRDANPAVGDLSSVFIFDDAHDNDVHQ